MTKEEAKNTIINHLLTNKNFYADYIIEALNKLIEDDEHFWHNVSEEGLPKEAGLYALELKDEFHIRADYYNKLFTYIPHLKIFRYQNQQDIHDYQEFGLDEKLNCEVVAWHKIPDYEEQNYDID